MKRIKSIAAIFSLALLTGCAHNYQLESDWGATPGYSSTERYQQIYRTWDYEGKQAMDDIDSVLLLRPPSRLTVWNVQ